MVVEEQVEQLVQQVQQVQLTQVEVAVEVAAVQL
jgi:hypothetical protein